MLRDDSEVVYADEISRYILDPARASMVSGEAQGGKKHPVARFREQIGLFRSRGYVPRGPRAAPPSRPILRRIDAGGGHT